MSDTGTMTQAGPLLGRRYRLGERIASGGMATVYRGTDEVLGRPVAVKIIHPSLAADAGFTERFRAEAQHAARLNHPNVVTVHDAGEDDDHSLFIVMELVEGTSLRELLHSFGRLDPATVKHIATGVAAALDHAHAKGLVHRDVKPENVLLTPDGRVKVVDFGVARALAATTVTGPTTFGTLAYIAPEQIGNGQVDGRADVYALGVLVYEMLTGRPPFEGDTTQAVVAARLERSVPSPGAGPDIDGAIAKATALNPQDRFDTAGELARALGEPSGLTPLEMVPAHMKPTQEITKSAPPISGNPTVVIDKEPKRRGRKSRLKTERKRRKWPFVAVAVLLVSAAGAYAAYPRSVAVPRIGTVPVAEARRALVSAGLEPGSETLVFHETVGEGLVTGLDPRPGRTVRKGTAVRLVVSKGPELFAVPSVTGKGTEEAGTILTDAGFTLGETTEAHSDNVPRGVVISQEPQADAEFRRGTAISMVVSLGPELRTVPDVKGKTPDQAKAALEEAGFAYGSVVDFSDSVPEGQVIRSDPSAGQRVAKGSKVTVAVSKGPKPFDMPSLVGLSKAAARDKAQSLGLVVANEYAVPGSGDEAGTVQGQNPAAGTEVRKGTRIDLYVAT